MFKLGTITETNETEVELKHPTTGLGLGAFITIAGPEHPARKRRVFDHARRLRQAMERAGKVTLDDPEVSAEQTLSMLCDCTLGWRGLADKDGKELVFSKQATRELYLPPENAWIRRQVQEAFDDAARFIKSSAEN